MPHFGLFYQLEHCHVEHLFQRLFDQQIGLSLFSHLVDDLVGSLIDGFIKHLDVVFVSFGIHVFTGVDSHHFHSVYFLRDLKHFIKVLEECFGFCPVAFFNVFSVDLDYSWESVDNEFFEEGTAGYGVSSRFYVDDFEVGDVLEFGDL